MGGFKYGDNVTAKNWLMIRAIARQKGMAAKLIKVERTT